MGGDRTSAWAASDDPFDTAHLGVTYDQGAIHRAIDYTDGYPYFIQEIGSIVWNIADGPQIRLAEVEASIEPLEAKLDASFFSIQEIGTRRAKLISRGLVYTPGQGLADFAVPQFEFYLKRNFPFVRRRPRRRKAGRGKADRRARANLDRLVRPLHSAQLRSPGVTVPSCWVVVGWSAPIRCCQSRVGSRQSDQMRVSPTGVRFPSSLG